MLIDIIVAIFLIICIFIGEKKGFLSSFISSFGWIISLGAAYLLRDPFTAYLEEHTNMHEDITVKITEYVRYRMQLQITGTADGTTAQGGVASTLRTAADNAIQSAAAEAATPVADAVFSLISLLLLMLLIKAVVFFLERIFLHFTSKGGAVGSLNSILGMVFSLIKGCITAYVLLLLIFSIAVIGNVTPLVDQLDSSFICTSMTQMNIVPDVFTNFN